MSSVQFPRRLAAVMHADVAGYSRLTEQDEEGTHLRVLEYKRVLAEQVLEHDGDVVHSEGDSLLAEFPNASNALICALAVQQSLALSNSELSEHRQVHFRIGINFSEVNVDEARQRIFGYGVNVAARLESLAEPGGICVSQSMQEAISGTLPVKLQYQGTQAVKNIAQPLRVFHASLAPGALLPQPIRQTLLMEQQPSPSTENAHPVGFRTPAFGMQPSHAGSSPALHDSPSISSDGLSIASSMAQRLFTPLLFKPLSRNYNNITRIPRWREHVAKTLDNTPRDEGIAIHTGFLQRWLRWNNSRFGPYNGSIWKLFDFCLLHAFIYSSLFFFMGLIFLQGDPFIGKLQVSVLEVGPQALANTASNPATDPASNSESVPGEAGALPLLLLLLAIYALADRLWSRAFQADSGQATNAFDARRFAAWFVLSSIIAFTLALNGFGAGLVALSVAMGAFFLRNMTGSGLLYTGITSLIIIALNTIVVGAEAGQVVMQNIAQSLDNLISSDIDRFLLMWFLFPLLNALFDTVSWRLSRRLGLALRFGRHQLSELWIVSLKRTRPEFQKPTLSMYWLSTLYWGLLDLAIALLLLAGVATGVGASLEIFDYIRRDYTGFYATQHVIDAFMSDPLGQGFWLSAMLITTLIPTTLHLMAVGSGLLSTLTRPVEQGSRLSSVLMYGPAHPLFELASRQAAWLQLIRVARTIALMCAWMVLLGWLILNLLNNGAALQLVGNSLAVGQQFAAIMIDLMR